MSRTITLVGLDCGSTTSCLVCARARLVQGPLGRVEITDALEFFRSELVFTPFDGGRIDAEQLAKLLDAWLFKAAVRRGEVFGGGALITGLAAQRENAAAVAKLLEARLGDAVIAAADAPRFESWLAFKGNCDALSREHAETPILNLDIGGGTTNLALGRNGDVLATGSLLVGARHFEFEPGTYRITRLSRQAEALLQSLHFHHRLGDTLSPAEVAAVAGCYVAAIEAAVNDPETVDPQFIQAAFAWPQLDADNLAVTLSGGVGELVYQLRRGKDLAATTPFGDLGVELARALATSPAVGPRLTLAPEGLGRATVFGLLRHSTELSGSTIYLPRPERLPLANVPLVGRVTRETPAEDLAAWLQLAGTCSPAAALQIELDEQDLPALRQLVERLRGHLDPWPLAPGVTLVLLVPANLGKTLGNMLTAWGTMKADLIVIDEVPQSDAHFVRLGRLRESVVPVWLYAAR